MHRTLLSRLGPRRPSPTDELLAVELACHAARVLHGTLPQRDAEPARRPHDDTLEMVAHELRVPLQGITTTTRLLRQGLCTVETALEAIDASAQRMSRLVGDLLDVTRLEAGSLVLQATDVAADRVLADCEAERARCAAAGLSLQVHRDSQLPSIHVDPLRLAQVLANLIDNAVKFAGAGCHVAVTARRADAFVQFAVADDGPGIPGAALHHVFERHWQGKADRRGVGLGLAIVRGIVEAHGGHVWVETAPGEGATFRFTVPVAAA